MRSTVRALAAVAAMTVAACGGQDPAPAGPGDDSAPPESSEIVSVEVTQSGGLAGIERTYVVTEETPGAQDVFAQVPASALEGDGRAMDKVLCCDRFQYDIEIVTSEGTTTLTAWEGSVDPELQALIAAVLESGRASDAATR